MHVDVARHGQTDLFEVIAPVPIRRDLLEFIRRHLVVILLRIAQFDAGAGRLRQRSFERENLFRVGAGFFGGLAEQRQHLGHVRDIRVPQFFRSVVVLGVVIAVRHPEPALDRLRNLAGAVLVILPGTEIEERVYADRV